MRRLVWLALFSLAACGGAQFDHHSNGKTVHVDRGERFFIDLEASAEDLPPDRQFTRGKPAVNGGAVRYVGHKPLKSKRLDRFEFEARGPGKSTISFSRSFDKNLPKGANGQIAYPKREIDYTVTVHVAR